MFDLLAARSPCSELEERTEATNRGRTKATHRAAPNTHPLLERKEREQQGKSVGGKAQGGSGSYGVNTNRPHVAMSSLCFPKC